MNHSFISPADSSDKCAKCKFPALAHTDKAVCECCPNIGPVEIRYGNMLMCDSCWEHENELKKQNSTPVMQQARVDAMNKAMEASRQIDASVSIRSDLFNAATTSIIEMKQLVDANPEITNKPYALAVELKTRLDHFKKVVFDANELIMDATSNQKAIQVYLNTLANQLRAEERAELKLQDITYQPKPVVKNVVKQIKNKPKSFDKAELRKYAAELGVGEFTLQMIVTSKGCSVKEAAESLKAMITKKD